MAASGNGESNLDDLGQRIRAARTRGAPKRSRAEGEAHAASVAIRMVTELVTGIGIGAAMGYGIDAAFGTLPLFLIVMGALGFAAGVKVMLRSADEINRKADAAAEAERRAKHEAGGDAGEKRG